MIRRSTYCQRPMNPLAGILATHRNTLGYREASPDGDEILFVLEGIGSARSQQTAHHSLLTANLPADFLAPPAPLIQHSTFSIQHWSYTFSAKEKDSETGLSYFGSRYYSSDLSIWLSVDPMSDKYPSLSPYVYCADNPVRLVDPNGEEIYEFDENGKFLQTSGDKGSPDQIAIIKKNGEIAISQAYKHGTIQLGLKGTVNQKNGTPVDVQSLKIKGDAQALDCFKFVADNSDVEWVLMRVGSVKGDKGLNYLASSQEYGHNSTHKLLNGTSYRIREHWHSHPKGDLTISEADLGFSDELRDKFGNVFDPNGYIPTFVYSQGKQKQYSPFLQMLDDNINKAWKEWKEGTRR